jgi:alkylhydroperoxidase family enzyme
MSPKIKTLSTEESVSRANEFGIVPQIAELNVFRTLLHHPRVAKVVNDLLLMLLFDGNELDARLRELLIMRIGWHTDCDYEWTQHWHIALKFGLTEEELEAVKDWRNAACFTDADRAVLAATDETLDDGKISDTTWAACEVALKEPEVIIELNVAIGAWRLISQFARSANLELEEGVASWPPNGLAPAS